MEIDMTSNSVPAVEAFLAAKAAFEDAEKKLKAAKKIVVEVAGGYGFLEGDTADLEIGLQARSSYSDELLKKYMTPDQMKACKVEGEAFPVVRVKAKKIAA
jgi:hypothetical protein